MDPIAIIVVLLFVNFLTLVIFGVILMASAQDIFAAQAAETQAIADLAARLGQSSGITTTEADQILTNVTANTAAISAIVP